MPTFYASGDSITYGYGVGAAQAYINRLAGSVGFTLVNKALGGDMAGDQSTKSQSVIMAEGDLGTLLIGVNDHRKYKADNAKQAHFRNFVRRCIGNLAQPARVSARAMTKTGTWSNSASATGMLTDALNAKISGQVSGRYVSVGYIIHNLNNCIGSRSDVYIDGTLAGSFSCDGYTSPMNTINGASWGCAMATFDVGSPGSHTVEIVNAVSGKRTYVDDIRGSDQIPVVVAVGNVIKMTAKGYTDMATNEGNVVAFGNIISEVVAEFQNAGHDVRLVDVFSALDTATDFLSDGFHPNVAGHGKLFTAFDAALSTPVVKLPYDKDFPLEQGGKLVLHFNSQDKVASYEEVP